MPERKLRELCEVSPLLRLTASYPIRVPLLWVLGLVLSMRRLCNACELDLQENGLSTSGSKRDLVRRLVEAAGESPGASPRSSRSTSPGLSLEPVRHWHSQQFVSSVPVE